MINPAYIPGADLSEPYYEPYSCAEVVATVPRYKSACLKRLYLVSIELKLLKLLHLASASLVRLEIDKNKLQDPMHR